MTGIRRLLPLTLCLLSILILSACATFKHNHDILALVDGTPVTKSDLEYALNIAHRREDMSSAKDMDIDKFVQKLIDEKVIIEEARRMGLEDDPDFQKKVNDYILTESVNRLYRDEVVQKASATEEDIREFYKKMNGRWHLGIISVETEEEASHILDLISRGEDFESVAKGPSKLSRKELTLGKMQHFMREAVRDLSPGEISRIKKDDNTFYIFKVISIDDPGDEKLERQREAITNEIMKGKIQKRSGEYIEELRRGARIRINNELLASLDLKDRKSLEGDTRMVVESDSISLTVSEFVTLLRPRQGAQREKILKGWIERKLVDEEALSRHYEENELREAVARYRNYLLRDAFIRNALVPKITISEEDLRDYYDAHSDDYLKPLMYKVQWISVKTRDEAEEILKSLNSGASFSWLAKTKSTDRHAGMGGSAGWISKANMPDEVAEMIDSLKPGDISPIINIGNAFRIAMLLEKGSREVKEFNHVKVAVQKAVFEEEFRKLYEDMTDELRKVADIKVFDERIKSVADSFNK
jgi:parvulin-like peptidyl-prolyl isomerase